MSSKKIITVTPELFNVSGKTRKKREKKEIAFNPIINPSTLKSKLLKRIKDHKMGNASSITKPKEEATFSDEFYSAVNYLSDLNKKQKQQKVLYNKTIKNHFPELNHKPITHNIPLDLSLPEELENTTFTNTSEQIKVNNKPIDNIPYGCLKGGHKKTYRQWQEDLKINETPGLQDILVARPPTPPKKTTLDSIFDNKMNPNISTINDKNNENITNTTSISKEQRLENIRNKLKQIEDNENYKKDQTIKELEEIEKQMGFNDIVSIPDIENNTPPISIEDIFQNKSKSTIENKNYIKRTIKRKFTLGKSDKLRKVAILIKNKQTRRNILNTQKELKKASITDVKRYLRQHGIVKTGTTCPPDILRKMYETALMTGEINNTNKDNLLHNFLNQDNIN